MDLQFYIKITAKLILSLMIVILFRRSLKKCKQLWDKNDKRIEENHRHINEIIQIMDEDKQRQSLDLVKIEKDLLAQHREESLSAAKDSVEIFKWYIAEVIAMIALLCKIWSN